MLYKMVAVGKFMEVLVADEVSSLNKLVPCLQVSNCDGPIELFLIDGKKWQGIFPEARSVWSLASKKQNRVFATINWDSNVFFAAALQTKMDGKAVRGCPRLLTEWNASLGIVPSAIRQRNEETR